jgi:hypothetical protein
VSDKTEGSGTVACTGKKKSACRGLVGWGNLKDRYHLEYRCKEKNNIKMDMKGRRSESVEWIDLA